MHVASFFFHAWTIKEPKINSPFPGELSNPYLMLLARDEART
jgi:hypothetical protein